ncbi:MAG TPA: FmdB family zinc ribbon protein [Ramlibacter sp.]|nr:FmdB family zinc ribbon protein [Ramlibacter sp.]
MPIYAYKCGSCGHAKDVLQKVSDAPLTTCPACGAESFSKQITAAGFQLKGSGWYVTDFRNNGGAAKSTDKGADKATDKPAESKPAESKSDSKPADTPAASPKSDAPSASAGGCGSACACH